MKKINKFNEYRQFLLDAMNFVNANLNGHVTKTITDKLYMLDDFEQRDQDFKKFLGWNSFIFIENYKNENSFGNPFKDDEFNIKLMEQMIKNTEICNILYFPAYPMIRKVLFKGIKTEEDFRIFDLILKNTNPEILNLKMLDGTIIEGIRKDVYSLHQNIKM